MLVDIILYMFSYMTRCNKKGNKVVIYSISELKSEEKRQMNEGREATMTVVLYEGLFPPKFES